MKTRYKLKSLRGLCMLVFALLLTTNTQAQTQTTTAFACDEYTWAVNGFTIDYSTYDSLGGVWYDTINGTSYLLELTMGETTSSTISESGSCGSYTYGDSTWATAGVYTYYDVNSTGCPDTLTINLSMNSTDTYTGSEILSVCNEYEDAQGNVHTESTWLTEIWEGEWIDATGAVGGCDSVVLVDLTVYKTHSTIDESNCSSYTVPSGDSTLTSSMVYTDTLTGAAMLGCDSLITINFTILATSETESYHYCESTTGTSGGYVWNGITCDVDGQYTHTSQNEDGCDHVEILNFTIGQDSEPTAEEVFGEVSWTDPNGTVYTESDTYTVNIGNEDGCAAYVTYLLTIDPEVYGCMDADNCNYNPDATADDPSACATLNAPVQEGNALTEETFQAVNWYTDADGSRWNMNDDAGVPQSIFFPTSDCNYYIGLVDTNGCETISAATPYARMAGYIGEITTYPNPVKDIVSLEFNNYKNQNVRFELINNNGTKVDEFITPNNKLDIDLTKYPSGVYYISFDSTKNKEEGCITQEKQKTVTKIILNK